VTARPRALVAVEDARLRRALAKELDAAGTDVVTAATADAALSLARTSRADVAVVDAANLGNAELMKATAAVPIIAVELVGGEALPDHAAAAIARGADLPWVSLAVRRAIEGRLARTRAEGAERRLSAELGEIITVSKSVRTAMSSARRSAETQASVLVTGEPGTGKELLARLALGGATPTTLDLSTITDVERRIASILEGSSTPALLFVLHAEELPVRAQEALLVALAARKQGRIRVVATADASLRERVKRGEFDPRLHVALSNVLIEVPPLRARPDDIGVLALHFLKAGRAPERDASIGHAAMRALRAYAWPHNVSELRAAMQHAAVVMRGDTVSPPDLPFVAARNVRHPLGDLPYPEARTVAIGAFEREYVGELLRRTSGNITQAARLAGMDRANFRRIAKRLEEEPARRRGSLANKS